MAAPPSRLTLSAFQETVASLAKTPNLLATKIWELLPLVVGPSINHFAPIQGHPGTMLEIFGNNFSPATTDNQVIVGGEPALVLAAEPTKLTVITSLSTTTGPVTVEVAGNMDTGPVDFTVLPAPIAAKGEDGPPIFYEGRGNPMGGTAGPSAGVSAQGTIKSLVVLCHPQDRVPANLTNERNDLITEFDNAPVYYDQVSFGDTDLQLTYTNWVQLTGNFADYVDSSIDNFAWPADRVLAEAAQGAVDQGNNLDDYVFMAVVMFLGGGFVRAWGGWSQSNFAWNGTDLNGNAVNINLTASHQIGLTTIGQNADWGRFAHEIAHSLVDAGAVLGEDVYSSDLVDPSVATAASFDLMGNHDSHPCFSGHFMQQLGYYDPQNVVDLQWDRNPFSQNYTLVAHGTAQNTDSSRKHLLRITVGAGVSYYVEVRQRMDPATGVFDTSIPVGGPNNGGLLVTKVFVDQVNVNQELRFITLLHDPGTQDVGAVIEDPARALTIRVNSVVQTNPLALSVTAEWAQTIADDVDGTFDLRLTQTSIPWVSDDIWVDRQPFGTIANETDGNGNIVATREKPRPGEINKLFAQVFNSGPDDTSNVKLTYYAITPPGVGDNGAWAPIGMRTLPNVLASTAASDSINWTPTVGEHTCLKVFASPQFGEITAGNNQCQENVFYFAPPASSPPEPVRMTIAVRNPLEVESPMLLTTINVPTGYLLHLPHKWVILPPKGERKMDLTIVPFLDISAYRKELRFRSAPIQVRGHLPRMYKDSEPVTGVPAFTHRTVGGITANVEPKYRAEIEVRPDKNSKTGIGVYGVVRPPLAAQHITIAVQPVGGQKFYVHTRTDAGGTFHVEIDPRRGDQTARRPWEGKLAGKIDGIFEIVCELYDAEDLAYARSKPLYFDLRAARSKEEVKPAAVASPRVKIGEPTMKEAVRVPAGEGLTVEKEPEIESVTAMPRRQGTARRHSRSEPMPKT